MVEAISAKVGQGIFLVFMHLLALGESSSESFDAAHVGYPFIFVVVPGSSEAVGAQIQTRQRPDGGSAISTKV